MKIYEIEPNEKVELIINYNNNKLNFQSVVFESKGKDLLVEPIRFNGKLLNLELGNLTLSILFNRKEGKPICWTNCDFKMTTIKKNVYIAISNKREGTEVNRRGSFRLSIGEEGKARIGNNKDIIEMILKNVSYSGFAILIEEKIDFEIGMSIEVAYRDPQLDTVLNLHGEIVRFEEDNDGRILLGCKLYAPNPILGKFIKDKQQAILSKRSGLNHQGYKTK